MFARIRHLLTAPRRPIYCDLTSLPGQVAGAGQAFIINLPDGRDDAGGPWPDPNAFSVRYVTEKTFLVHWVCTVKLRDCSVFPDTTANPLSLRWEDSLSFDEEWTATYRRVGTLVLSTRSTETMDAWRRKNLAPLVAPGFRRTQAKYTRSRDGLRCDFEFVDKQMRISPPFPAVKMRIVQSETLPLVGGMRLGQVSVSLKGAQNASPVDLERWSCTIAFARMWAANPLSSQGRVIGNGTFTLAESESDVGGEFTLSYKVNPAKDQQAGVAATLKKWSDQVLGQSAFVGNPPVPTQQGRDPTQRPILPWVGFGTSPSNPSNPNGFAAWADPTASLAPGPADGLGLAKSIALYAALLQDPCGQALDPTPYAADVIQISTDVPSLYDSPAGGTGAAITRSPISNAQLSAAVTSLNANEYPSTYNSVGNTAFYNDDGLPGAYDYWQCLNEYVFDPGNLVLPVCDKDGTNIVVNSNSQRCTLRRRWAACRDGAMPQVPPTDFGDDNWVLVRRYDGVPDLRILPDGVSVRYEIKGIYEYEALDASKVDRKAEIGPFVDRESLRTLVGWPEDARTLTNILNTQLSGNPNGGGISVLFGGGGGSPLGSGDLLGLNLQ